MNPRAKELVEQLRKESKDTDTTNVSLFHVRRQASPFGDLLVVLGEESERQSERLEKQMTELVGIAAEQKILAAKLDGQTDTLIGLTRSLKALTIWLIVLTVALLALEAFHFFESRKSPIQVAPHAQQINQNTQQKAEH